MSLLSMLAAIPTVVGPLRPATVLAQANMDPLPSWNNGEVKASITNFVSRVTTSGSPDFVEASGAIVTFDNDGTLWCEQPMYVQLAFALDRIKALVRSIRNGRTSSHSRPCSKKQDMDALAGSGLGG